MGPTAAGAGLPPLPTLGLTPTRKGSWDTALTFPPAHVPVACGELNSHRVKFAYDADPYISSL